MIKVIVLHPNADTKYNREHHLALTKALPGLRKFTVNETMPDPLTGQKPPCAPPSTLPTFITTATANPHPSGRSTAPPRYTTNLSSSPS